MIRRWCGNMAYVLVAAIAGLSMTACQNPNSPDETVNYNEALDITIDPDPIVADTSTGGKLYRVVRGNNQPDELLPYDWHTVFSSTLVLNDKANDEDLNLDYPVRITGATLTVKQATGGIITPPSGTEKESFEYRTARGQRQPVFRHCKPHYALVRGVVRPSKPSEGMRRDADLFVRR